MKRIFIGTFRVIGRIIHSTIVAIITVLFIGGGIAALANYSATQGTGTTFASLVISTVHYAAMVLCDATAGQSQCATVKPASTSPVATDTALVVSINPNSCCIVPLGNALELLSVPVTMASDQGAIGSKPLGSSASADGIVPVVAGSAVSSLVLKAGPGNLYSAYAECSAACWLMIVNATAAPSNGSTTAGIASGNLQDCVPIAAGGTGSVNYRGGPPEVFSVGIVAVISSTTCATLTLATTGFIHGDVQ